MTEHLANISMNHLQRCQQSLSMYGYIVGYLAPVPHLSDLRVPRLLVTNIILHGGKLRSEDHLYTSFDVAGSLKSRKSIDLLLHHIFPMQME